MSKISGASPSQAQSIRPHGNPPPSLREGDQVHTVQRGETLSRIARQHDLSLQELTAANPQVSNPDRIWPGDQLRIPTASHQTETPTPATDPAQQYYGDQFTAQSSPAPNMSTPNGPIYAPPPQVSTPATESLQQTTEAPQPQTTTAGQLATGATLLGAPTQLATDATQRAANTVRSYANTARTNAARIFAEGGEEALQAPRAHQSLARLESAAVRTARTASRIRTAGNALNVAGGVLTAVDQYQRSNAQTTTGRLASSTGAGSLAVAVGARHPYFAAADAAANLLGAPDTPSNVLGRSIDTIATVTEGAITGDTRGIESLHERNLHGDNGPIFQAAAEAGEFWAEHGIVGGLSEFGDAVGDLWDSIWD